MTEKTQTQIVEDYMKELDLNPKEMAELMAIPYMSFRDLRNGRRTLRPIHARVLDMAVAFKRSPKIKEFWPKPQEFGRQSAA